MKKALAFILVLLVVSILSGVIAMLVVRLGQEAQAFQSYKQSTDQVISDLDAELTEIKNKKSDSYIEIKNIIKDFEDVTTESKAVIQWTIIDSTTVQGQVASSLASDLSTYVFTISASSDSENTENMKYIKTQLIANGWTFDLSQYVADGGGFVQGYIKDGSLLQLNFDGGRMETAIYLED